MKLFFETVKDSNLDSIEVTIDNCIIAGWAGRNLEAIEHHILELQELGVPRPSSVPLFYRVASNQITQDNRVQVVGEESSGEAEVCIFSYNDELYVSLASDHTDRALEAHSVALSKQICAKPVANKAWLFSDVSAHWDQLRLRSWVEENGKKITYQDGELASLLDPLDLILKLCGDNSLPNNTLMTCGTVAVIGSIRPSNVLHLELYDPILNRNIKHSYTITSLPEIA